MSKDKKTALKNKEKSLMMERFFVILGTSCQDKPWSICDE